MNQQEPNSELSESLHEKEVDNIDDKIGKIVNKHNNKKLSQEVNKIETLLNNALRVDFYVACKDRNKFKEILPYISKKLKVNQEDVFTINVGQEKIKSIRNYLTEIIEKIKQSKGKRFIVLTNNFERLVSQLKTINNKNYELNLDRCAHDFDQDNIDSKTLKELKDIDKKIIFLNHIGDQEGEDIYNDSIRSACGSQFSRKIIEIE